MTLEGGPAQDYTALEDVGKNSDLGACDWEEWPAQSEPEGRFVVGLPCQPQFIHYKHHVRAKGYS